MFVCISCVPAHLYVWASGSPPLLLPVFIRRRILSEQFNVMPWHVRGTFWPFQVASHPYLYTPVMLAAPANVHTPRQSNKARANSGLLFSSTRLTTCKHVHDLYSQSHSGPVALISVRSNGFAV